MKRHSPHRTPELPRRPRESHVPSPRREGATEIVVGLRASLAVMAKRPDDILRVACTRSAHEDAEALVRFAAARRLPLDEVTDVELERIAQSNHHEGLAVETRPRRFTPAADLADILTRKKGLAIALDRVRNPYNIGAILRTAAFFGVDAALLGAPAPHPALPPDAVRVAEGGAEQLTLSRTTDLADTLSRLKARGVKIVGADGASTHQAMGFRFERPTVIVMGHEREGMGDRVKAQCDAIVAIAGTGAVESLNVAVAAGVLIAEATRKR